MATVDDVEVANASFPNVRQDLNDILEAITTNFSADTEPTTTYPNQFWYETDTNLLYIRNEADDAWITLASINQTTGEWEPRTAVIQAIDSAGIALKTDDGTTRFSISDAGVVSFENYSFPSADGTAGQVLSTDGSGTLTFEDSGAGDKIEEGNSSVEVVDTGTGHVAVTVDGSETARFDANGNLGIGTSSPAAELEIEGATPEIRIDSTNLNARTYRIHSDGQELYIEGIGSSGSVFFGEDGTYGALIDLGTGDLSFNSGYGSAATAYGCRAWVNFDGTGTVAIRDSGNVSSITDNGAGNYNVNFSTAMPDANFSAVASGRINEVSVAGGGSISTTTVRVEGSNASGTLGDASYFFCAVFR